MWPRQCGFQRGTSPGPPQCVQAPPRLRRHVACRPTSYVAARLVSSELLLSRPGQTHNAADTEVALQDTLGRRLQNLRLMPHRVTNVGTETAGEVGTVDGSTCRKRMDTESNLTPPVTDVHPSLYISPATTTACALAPKRRVLPQGGCWTGKPTYSAPCARWFSELKSRTDGSDTGQLMSPAHDSSKCQRVIETRFNDSDTLKPAN